MQKKLEPKVIDRVCTILLKTFMVIGLPPTLEVVAALRVIADLLEERCVSGVDPNAEQLDARIEVHAATTGQVTTV